MDTVVTRVRELIGEIEVLDEAIRSNDPADIVNEITERLALIAELESLEKIMLDTN